MGIIINLWKRVTDKMDSTEEPFRVAELNHSYQLSEVRRGRDSGLSQQRQNIMKATDLHRERRNTILKPQTLPKHSAVQCPKTLHTSHLSVSLLWIRHKGNNSPGIIHSNRYMQYTYTQWVIWGVSDISQEENIRGVEFQRTIQFLPFNHVK